MKKLLAAGILAAASLTIATPAHATIPSDALDVAYAYQVAREAWRAIGPADRAVLCEAWDTMPAYTLRGMTTAVHDAVADDVTWRDTRTAVRRLLAGACS